MELVLADGSMFSGRSFGALREARGEVVFNTGMVGYEETLTDPSYRGRILVATYPLQGNYGVPRGPCESARIQVQALIVHQLCHQPSHHASTRTLGGWLKDHGVPAIEGVDTRSLTRHLRRHGTIEGQLLFDASEQKACLAEDNALTSPEAVEMAEVIGCVAPKEVRHYPGGTRRILLVDTGTKENIVRCLQRLGATVIRVPWNYPLGDVSRSG
jgi:carbamoyl-phosphate synthase small subunit